MKWLFFFTFIEECCVVIEKNIDQKLANRISYQIWYKRCLKGEFGRGGPNLRRGVHIRCDTSFGFFFRSGANRSQVLTTHAQPMSTWHSVMADEEKLSRCKISTDIVYINSKHKKYAHIARGRPTLKYVERFRNGFVREPYERSLYERTFLSEPFIEKHTISTELSMLIDRSIGANLIVYVDLIVNQSGYQ